MPGLIATLAEKAPAPAPGLLTTWYTAIAATTRPANAIRRPAIPRSIRTPELAPPATRTSSTTNAAATARPMSPPLIAVQPFAVISSGITAARPLKSPANAPASPAAGAAGFAPAPGAGPPPQPRLPRAARNVSGSLIVYQGSQSDPSEASAPRPARSTPRGAELEEDMVG